MAVCVPNSHQLWARGLRRKHAKREGQESHKFIPKSTQVDKQVAPEINTLSPFTGVYPDYLSMYRHRY